MRSSEFLRLFRLVILIAVLTPFAATAQLYKCESNGTIAYSDKPCAEASGGQISVDDLPPINNSNAPLRIPKEKAVDVEEAPVSIAQPEPNYVDQKKSRAHSCFRLRNDYSDALKVIEYCRAGNKMKHGLCPYRNPNKNALKRQAENLKRKIDRHCTS